MESIFKEFRGLFEAKQVFVLATHLNADGDGLGAQFSLAHFLVRHGKRVRIVNVDPIPHQYEFLASGVVPEIYDPATHDSVIESAEVIVILDNSSANRLGAMRDPIQRSPAVKVCIDHHPHPDTQWDVMVIDEKACATGEMIYRFIREVNGQVAPEEAVPIYVSIVTDTGNFRFSNTTPHVLQVAADLVSKGVDVPTIYQRIFERNSPAFVRLLGTALASIRQDESGRLGWIVLSRDVMHSCGADGEDTSDIINGILTIEGTRLALLFKEMADGRTKISLRSKGSIDVNRLAAEFGGGGHRNASGAVIPLPLDQVVTKILEKARALVA
jgi:phosphoesterase RecJ-like protein